ncbi:hypothetical protein [Fimbriiglobus ruber]|uniref:Uncharacterized protein n=1 Tax=Fimbriiglobus ruber TaxID=1908690 RepID=A0A225E7A1_9BACT|nr:hypothetical protein [Fimbriiglobus ruber]OWK46668.1 hypothetical protein FRUB_00367 [Fimbriiglobus ruber]
MDDLDPDIQRLLTEAADLPDGPVKVELITEATRVADVRGDVQAGFQVRKELMETALRCGQPDVLTVAFSWCLAQSDRDPVAIPVESILWEYRWVVNDLTVFPQVPLRQVIDAIADMSGRYRAAGSLLRAIYLMTMNVALRLRNPAMAAEAYAKWKQARRDVWSDSARTEQSFVASFLVFTRQYQAAVDHCPQVLAGRPDDLHFFGTESSELLMPLLALGRVADAVRVQRSGYRYVARKLRYLDSVGYHVEFLARMNNFATAVKAFEDHATFAVETQMPLDRLEFFRAALILVERMRRAGTTTLKLRLPATFPAQAGDNKYDLGELAARLRSDVADLGAKFDARNENTYYADATRELETIIETPVPLP